MNTKQLLKVLPYTDVSAGGVYAADKIPWGWARPCAIIANTDDHTKPGTHWVAFYLSANGRGVFFDSFGRPPSDPRFIQRLNRNCRDFEWNRIQIQSYLSNICGNYCIVALHWLSMGKSLSAFCKLFTNNHKQNDQLLMKMYKHIIANKKKRRNKSTLTFKNLSGNGIVKHIQYSTCNHY